MAAETIFTWGAPPLKFGDGALDEIGFDAAGLGMRHLALVSDPGVANAGLVERGQRALDAAGVAFETYVGVHAEPTDASIGEAVDWVRSAGVDGFVGIGGGSVIDTTKAMNLLATNPGELHDFLNPPIGAGRSPEAPLMPMIAVPTTAGTGSESTPVCVLDVLALRVKTGISHRSLRPTLAVVDPSTTRTLSPEVAAASGMDVLCHALESFTARPYSARPSAPAGQPRAAYNGANPISDVWSMRALELLGRWFRRAVHDGDAEARRGMMLAATYAGIGFGNAGVHIPHACAYPIAGMVRDYVPAGYEASEPMVPHGQSVVLTAPAAFRFTYSADPERHERVASLIADDPTRTAAGPDALPSAIVELSRDLGIPSGLGAVGYVEADIPALVDGAVKQQRLLTISPRSVDRDALAEIFGQSMHNW
ncbi:MAG TPA: hydroxyacid-oxoacid transhydrogenase [Candidatus Limnocylindrales bacterium]|nr:hydroxyacid-oxoacid transhydrogenase [Candidatus Limnocylindrales bacterium]